MPAMQRDEALERIGRDAVWDLLVVGGGATGLGVAVDAASRGYQTLLLEQDDFCKGTSSRSTKLIHGGVRYLAQGDVRLVRGALRERGLLLANAPHLVQPLWLVLPVYRWWEGPYYWAGLKAYDLLSGRWSLGRSAWLSRRRVLDRLPGLRREGLRGGVRFLDAQFDDARLGLCLARTADRQGAALANYVRVTGLLREQSRVAGVEAVDEETGRSFRVQARVVVNATGVFADALRQQEDPSAEPLLQPSQGAHLVVEEGLLPAGDALIIPRTEDGRVLFAIPWQGRVLVGTTDTPVEEVPLEPRPLRGEIQFLERHLEHYFDTVRPVRTSTFAGIRPLVREQGEASTASLSREHTLLVSPAGVVTITGGKWTTYRQMAEETVDAAARVAGLSPAPCRTRRLRLHGWCERPEAGVWRGYGADAPLVRRLIGENPAWAEPLHPRLPYCAAQVVWGVRREMARTLEDVLSRRLRALLLDAAAALEAAPAVAELIGEQLGWTDERRSAEVTRFRSLAEGYLPPPA